MLYNEMLELVLSGGFFNFVYNNQKFELISLLENGKTNNTLFNSSRSKSGCIALCKILEDESHDQYFSSVDDFLNNAHIGGISFLNALPRISEFHRITT